MNHVLTADIRRAAERGGNVRVKVDHEVPLLGKPFVTVLDLLRDPLPKVVAAEGIDDVDDPLPRQLGHVSLFRQVTLELLRTLAELKDGGDGQRLVHGHVQVLGVLALEDYRHGTDWMQVVWLLTLLLAADDVLEEVDGDALRRR